MLNRAKSVGYLVSEFHEAFDLKPRFNKNMLNSRLDLLLEEVMETVEAAGFTSDKNKGLSLSNNPNKEKLLKELCDVVYVAVGWAVAHGWNFDEAFKRVHKSNMSKLENGKVKYREDGKVLKGRDYKEPELGDLVK